MRLTRFSAALVLALGLLVPGAGAQEPAAEPEPPAAPAQPVPGPIRVPGQAAEAEAADPGTTPEVQLTTLLATPGGGIEWPDPQKVERRGRLTFEVGIACLVTLPTTIDRVALADESIARVQIISPREVLLTGLVPGRTTFHVWLTDGRRLLYLVQVVRDLDQVTRAVQDLDPSIRLEASPDGRSVILYGEVNDRETAEAAEERAEILLGMGAEGPAEVVNLLRYPGSTPTNDEWLRQALVAIDPRIRLRRIQVDVDPDPGLDTYILEGRVRDVPSLVRAILLAERQLGGFGDSVSAFNTDRVTSDRSRGFLGNTGFGGGGFGGGGGGGGGAGGNQGGNRSGVEFLRGGDIVAASLGAQLARGQVITSDSGRVVSLLEVDELPQVLVSIRVLEVDRGKARTAGINFRFDSEHLSIGSYLSPSINQLPAAGELRGSPDVSGVLGTNLVGAFVDQTSAILAAIDFLQQKNFARAVAEPNVLTLSGELASVLVGGEVPIPTTAVGNVATVQGFFFQDFGVRLDIRPTVAGDDLVALEVAPSIIRVAPGLGVQDVPGFQVQRVNTAARVRAGQSLVLGGLLSFEEGLEDRRLPGLGKIPIFRWKRRTRQERELLFLITPRIVADDWEDEAEPVDATPELEEVGLPELGWPEGRRRWNDEYEPLYLGEDTVPPDFRLVRPWEEGEEYFEEAAGEIEERLDREPPPLPPAGEMAPPPEPTPVVEPAPEPMVIEPLEAEAAGPGQVWTVVAEKCLNLRKRPSTWADVIECVPRGTVVEKLGEEMGWFEVRLPDGREGWMAAGFLELRGVPELWTVRAKPCLKLRENPGVWSRSVDCLPPGTLVQKTEARDVEWFGVRLPDGREGWMAAKYLKHEPAPK